MFIHVLLLLGSLSRLDVMASFAGKDPSPVTYVCEGDTGSLQFLFRQGYETTVTKLYAIQLSGENKPVYLHDKGDEPILYDKRASFEWDNLMSDDRLTFELKNMTLSDATSYEIYIYRKTAEESSFEQINAMFIVLTASACPDREMIVHPRIQYRTMSSIVNTIHSGNLELSEPGYITILATIPAADPPVNCLISSGPFWYNCSGIPDREKMCEAEFFIGQIPAQEINVTLSFVAYQPLTTRIYARIAVSPQYVYVCEGEAMYLQYVFKHGFEKTVTAMYAMKTSPEDKPLITKQMGKEPVFYDKRANLWWITEGAEDQLNFQIDNSSFSDTGSYGIKVFHILAESPNYKEINAFLKVLAASACPARESIRQPSIAYQRKSLSAIPIQNGTLELSEPENIKLLVTMPAADPPVYCLIATNATEQDERYCSGIQERDKTCVVELVLFKIRVLEINVTMTFIAYRSWLTQVHLHIKESNMQEETTTWTETPSGYASMSSTIHSPSSTTYIVVSSVSVIISVILSLGGFLLCVLSRKAIYQAYHTWKVKNGDEEKSNESGVEMTPMMPTEDSDIRRSKLSLKETKKLIGDRRKLTLSKKLKKSSYMRRLKSSVKEINIKRNRHWNVKFGVRIETVLYCDLVIEPRIADIPGEGTRTPDKEEYTRWTPESLKTTKTISIDDILGPHGVGRKKTHRILLLGAAGMGKTTLSQEIASRWADEKLKNTVPLAAYNFECKSFTYDIKQGNQLSLIELLSKRHGPGNLTDKEQVTLREVVGHESDILIIIDGLNELAKWVECEKNAPEIYDVRERREIHHVLYNLILGRLLPKSKVLVTSRPVSSVKQQEFDGCLVVLGFSETSINKCMQALCPTEQLFKEVADYLQQTDLLAECVVPLNCMLLGVALGNYLSPQQDSRPISLDIFSMTRLYIALGNLYMRNGTEHRNERDFVHSLASEQISAIQSLAKLASNGMLGEETTVAFDRKDLTEAGLKSDDDGFGLLEIAHISAPDASFELPFVASFLHLTAQEFFAALHIASSWDANFMNKLSPQTSQRLGKVCMFISGLLGDPEGRKTIETIYGNLSNDQVKNRLTEMLKRIAEGEGKGDILLVIRCLGEGKIADLLSIDEARDLEGMIVEQKDGYINLDLSCFTGGLLPNHLLAVGYWIRASTTITSLQMDNCGINSSGIRALCERGSLLKLKLLNLKGNKISDDGAKDLAQQLRYTTCIECLFLESNELSETYKTALSKEFGDRIRV